jgi:hypothetical protein
MPVYLFDEIAGSGVIEDNAGVELADVRAAKVGATKAAREPIASLHDALDWQFAMSGDD